MLKKGEYSELDLIELNGKINKAKHLVNHSNTPEYAMEILKNLVDVVEFLYNDKKIHMRFKTPEDE